MTGPKTRPKISQDHLTFLEGQAISRDVLQSAGVYTLYDADDLPKIYRLWPGRDAYPGLIFPWRGYDGGELLQLRPDKAVAFDDHSAKYVFPKNCEMILNVHPLMDEAVDDPSTPLIIIEGTKQYLAAVSALAPVGGYAAVGMPGCYGWKQHRKTLPDLKALAEVLPRRKVLLCFDADWKHNPDVWHAAKGLTDQLRMYGVNEISYIAVPGSGTEGLDDQLADVPDKTEAMLGLIARAETKLPPRPPAKSKASEYTDESGAILVQKVVDALLGDDADPLALAPDGSLAVYRNGVYELDHQGHSLTKAIGDLLGDKYSDRVRASILSLLKAELHAMDFRLPTEPSSPWLNLRNGMLDLDTLTLHPHDPDHFSTVQLPFDWNPDATCPTYDKWIVDVAGEDQVELIEQVAAQMLYPQGRPTKALFLFGPSRSGKSTLLRILAAIAGPANTAAVTLQDMTRDRFATSDLFGKILNLGADLSAKGVSDVSTFKVLTGDDLVSAQFKGRDRFKFVNHAVLAFSANEVPRVDETSSAYRARTAKIRFGRSYEGSEDPSIERRMMAAELPGVLRRLARTGQRKNAAGGKWALENVEARAEFNEASDIVTRWFVDTKQVVAELPATSGESKIISTGVTMPARWASTPTELNDDFVEWCAQEQEKPPFGRNTLARVLTSGYEGVFKIRIAGTKNKAHGLNVINKTEDDHLSVPPSTTPLSGTSGESGGFEGEVSITRVVEEEDHEGGETSQELLGTSNEVAPSYAEKPPLPPLSDLPRFQTVEVECGGLHEKIYSIIAADPLQATENKIREALGISSTEFHAVRDFLISVGVVARRKGKGFDVTGRLVRVRPAYVQPDRARMSILRRSPTSIYDSIPDPVCVDCGEATGPRNAMLPHCPACSVPFDLDVETP